MFDVWHDAARTYHQALRLSLADVEGAHAVVAGAFGTSWLEEQWRRTGRPERRMGEVHPIFRSLVGGTLESILDVCELAGYLTFFMRDAKIGEILTAMRDHGKYESTFFEIAMAWRFARAGCAVAFYPPTPKGMADFAVTVSGIPAVVEVSVFPGDPFQRPAVAFGQFLLGVVKRAAESLGLPYFIAVELVVDEESDGDFQGELRRAVVDSIRRFAVAPDGPPSLDRTPFGTVLVRRTRPGEGPDTAGNFSGCTRSVRRPKSGTLHDLPLSPLGGDTDWVHLAYDDSPRGQQRRIAAKLKKENAQLSGVADARVIILDASGLGMGVLSDEDADTAATLAQFDREHPSVSEAWLLTRVWSEDPPRWLYRGIAHRNALATHPLPESTSQAVLADLDVLSPAERSL